MTDKGHNRKLFGEVLNKLLHENISIDVPVFGLSMFPFLLPGDIVRVIKWKECGFSVGDIIIFSRNGRLIAHRVLKIDCLRKLIHSKGDGLIKRDLVIPYAKVQAIVIHHYRKEKEIKWINKPFVKRGIAFISPSIGFITFYMGLIWHKYFF